MLVFIEKNLVFLSMPKTASTAFIAALTPFASMIIKSPPGVKHMGLRRFDKRIRPLIEKQQQTQLETLAVIRHPIDWLGSWYRYRRRDAIKNTQNSTQDISFNTFVQEYMRQSPPDFAKVGDQAKFLQPAKDAAPITHIFQYEDQSGLKQFLEQRLKVTFKLEKKNVSPKKSLILRPEIEDQLHKKCRRQFDIWQNAGPHKL
ncbi:MAG: gamma-glutamyl kinase [Marinovum sp.]|nr:gamma-glutamyl kinase [Marinovum sp.]MDG2230777.1 sulfotransferase family 2 domain-containing protein [Paracoccaceae bacterium]